MSNALSQDAFNDALPWFVNGTLQEESREQVEEYLRLHPEARTELTGLVTLREAVQTSATSIPADLGWDEYASKLGLCPKQARPRLRDIVATFWRSSEVMRSPRFAVCACLLVLMQSAAIFQLSPAGIHSGYASDRGAPPAPQQIRVRFKPNATEYEIRKLLLSVDAHVVDGPNQLGDYSLGVAEDRIAEVRQALEQSPLVDMVNLPPRMGCCNVQ